MTTPGFVWLAIKTAAICIFQREATCYLIFVHHNWELVRGDSGASKHDDFFGVLGMSVAFATTLVIDVELAFLMI